MEDEASPIRPRVLLLACAAAVAVFAASATVAWRQFQMLGSITQLDPSPAAASPSPFQPPERAEAPVAGFAPAATAAGIVAPEPGGAPTLVSWPHEPRGSEAAPAGPMQRALLEFLGGGAAFPSLDDPPAPAFLPEALSLPGLMPLPEPAPASPLPFSTDLAMAPEPEITLAEDMGIPAGVPPLVPAQAPPDELPDESLPRSPGGEEAIVVAGPPSAPLPSADLAILPVADASADDQPRPPAPLPAAAAPVRAPARPRARICAGSPTGNYTFAAREIAAHAGALGELEVITTAGSGDNLRRLADGECEMGFSQADVLALRAIEHPQQVAGLDPFKRVYGEYAHILCPLASGWTNAGAFDGRTRLIVGGDGSGTAETWRALIRAAPALAAVQRVNDPVNLVAVNRVKDSRDTCMLWISGLNSGDMQGANRMSANTPDGRRAMRLVSVTVPELRGMRLADGQPIYRFEQITARSGSYENLLDTRVAVNAEGRRFVQGGSVTVPVVDAVLVVRRDFLAALPGRGSEIVSAVEDAGPAIWARVSPRR